MIPNTKGRPSAVANSPPRLRTTLRIGVNTDVYSEASGAAEEQKIKALLETKLRKGEVSHDEYESVLLLFAAFYA